MKRIGLLLSVFGVLMLTAACDPGTGGTGTTDDTTTPGATPGEVEPTPGEGAAPTSPPPASP
ncbi:hypothetical protein [Egbenema bharatensis]|uniref:hypothetical protein n=1 Tax=Egbenema bharatensis TaxID=3463334 RepID=UPI003A85E65E